MTGTSQQAGALLLTRTWFPVTRYSNASLLEDCRWRGGSSSLVTLSHTGLVEGERAGRDRGGGGVEQVEHVQHEVTVFISHRTQPTCSVLHACTYVHELEFSLMFKSQSNTETSTPCARNRILSLVCRIKTTRTFICNSQTTVDPQRLMC